MACPFPSAGAPSRAPSQRATTCRRCCLPPRLQERALGENLRRRYMDTVQSVLMVTGHSRLCDNNGTLR